MNGGEGLPTKESDEDLVRRFQEGSEKAFNELVRRYKNPLMNFAYRFLGDYDEADDVVQETFIRLARNAHAYRPMAKFSTWLYTIAANLARTQLRRRKRRSLFSLGRSGRDQEATQRDLPDTRYSADALAEASLLRKHIEDALAQLPPKYREVVILCDIQELAYEEICEITGANIGTVKSRLNRGRTKLQELLKDVVGE